MKKCKVPMCEKVVLAKGLCSNHYQRMRRNGDPTIVKQIQFHGITFKERFFKYVICGPGKACWPWLGFKDKNYYSYTKQSKMYYNVIRFAV